MNAVLLSRVQGYIGAPSLQRYYTARLLQAIQPAPSVAFDGSAIAGIGGAVEEERKSHKRKIHQDDDKEEVWNKPAHRTGVNAIAIDKFEGRYLLSGGADSSILLWDLESGLPASRNYVHRPIGAVKKSPSTHKFGITHISFYPFDSLAFLSSSYDHTLKIYQTETLSVAASFDLDAVIYSHSSSPIAEHLLVACATQHPAIRLVDLRSGASTHSLAGHHGAVLSVAWSPRDAHILASGGSDGVVRLWDIRKSGGSLGILDLDDAVGMEMGRRPRGGQGKSHAGACNGVLWSDDGEYIVSAGHDEQVRVWDASTGANTLTHFGPTLKNPHSATLLPLLVPSHVSSVGQRIMIYPNGKDLLMFDMLEGTLLKRLRVLGLAEVPQDVGRGQRNLHHRTTSMGFRTDHVEIYSAHSDGFIRLWAPRTLDDADIDEEEAREARETDHTDDRLKKRQALDQIYRDLTRKPITFT